MSNLRGLGGVGFGLGWGDRDLARCAAAGACKPAAAAAGTAAGAAAAGGEPGVVCSAGPPGGNGSKPVKPHLTKISVKILFLILFT